MNQSSLSKPQSNRCCVCHLKYYQLSSSQIKAQIIKCEVCSLSAHKYCYAPNSKRKDFICDGCAARKEKKRRIKCQVCRGGEGMLKGIKNMDKAFGHVLCLLFSPLYLVESYSQLSFVSIDDHGDKQQQFVCRLCSKLGDIRNSCSCSYQNCMEIAHWKCMILDEHDRNSKFWVHSMNRLNANNKAKLDLNSFYKRMEVYLNNYFDEQIFEQDESHENAIQSYGDSQKNEIRCPKHVRSIAVSCKCEKENHSSLIYCNYCQSLNHTKCEKIKNEPDIYKCLQCQGWQNIIKAKKRPFLDNYPNMNIDDYIYLHAFLQENGYRLVGDEQKLIKRLPILPSLHFYSLFTSKYLCREFNTEICLETLKKATIHRKILSEQQLKSAIKVIKLVLCSYNNLQDLKCEFIQLDEKPRALGKASIGKLLKEYNKKFLKVKVNQSISDESSKEEKRELSQEEEQQKEREKQDELDREEETLVQVTQTMKPIEYAPQKKSKEQNNGHQKTCLPSENQIKLAVQRISLKCLEKDLQEYQFQITLRTRLAILQSLPSTFKACHNFLVVQTGLAGLMASLNSLEDKKQKFSMISDLRNSKSTQENIKVYFDYFLTCKNYDLNQFPLLRSCLRAIAQELIMSNTKKQIKTMEQIEGYEIILSIYNFDVDWLKVQIQKKKYIDSYLSRIELILKEGEIINQMDYGDTSFCLATQVLMSAFAYCQYNKMDYYLPRIESYMVWYRIYKQCKDNIPLHLLMPRLKEKENRLDGDYIVKVRNEMVQSKFPSNILSDSMNFYAQKFKKVSKKLYNFLEIFAHNLTNLKTSPLKYERKQVVEWIVEVKTSGFECEPLLVQVQEIIFNFDQLLIQMARIGGIRNETRYGDLARKIELIPIKQGPHQAFEDDSKVKMQS